MGEKEVMVIKGRRYGNELHVHEDRITLKYRGNILIYCLTGRTIDKTIHYHNITSVGFVPPRIFHGAIQIYTSGSCEYVVDGDRIVNNENVMTFKKKDWGEVERGLAYINERIGRERKMTQADELRKFKELFDEGIISEEDFISKKRKILDID